MLKEEKAELVNLERTVREPQNEAGFKQQSPEIFVVYQEACYKLGTPRKENQTSRITWKDTNKDQSQE